MVDFLLRYRLYIAPVAFFGGLSGYPLPTLKDHSAHLIAACFASLTMGVYLLNKVTDLGEDERNPNAQPIRRAWVRGVLAAALPLILLPPLYLWFRWPQHFWLYIGLMLLGFWYCYRIPIFAPRVRLKDVLIIKNVATAISWASVLILCPALLGIPYATASAYFIKVFALLMIVGVLWDVRDMEGDALAGVRTVPNTWGVNAAKALCVAFLALLSVAGLLIPEKEVTFWPTILATLAIILMVNKSRKPMFYQLIVLCWVGDTFAILAGWRYS